MKPACVLDASAFLAYLQNEPGADTVENWLSQGVWISAVNWAEVLQKTLRWKPPAQLVAQLREAGILDRALFVHPVTSAIASITAEIYPLTHALGLSLGDRICLALSSLTKLPAITADRTWEKLPSPFEIVSIR